MSSRLGAGAGEVRCPHRTAAHGHQRLQAHRTSYSPCAATWMRRAQSCWYVWSVKITTTGQVAAIAGPRRARWRVADLYLYGGDADLYLYGVQRIWHDISYLSAPCCMHVRMY